MNRRDKLENIIIGTLLESNAERNFYDDCCSVITPDMFNDEVNRRIFVMVSEMNRNGKVNTTPCDIFEEYGNVVVDIMPRMCELVTDYSFIYLKTKYNEEQYILSEYYGIETKYTDVCFGDYVKRFIKAVFENEKERSDNNRRGKSVAA